MTVARRGLMSERGGLRFRIACGDCTHEIVLETDGRLTFRDHPEAFEERSSEIALEKLAGRDGLDVISTEGAPIDTFHGCVLIADLLIRGKLVQPGASWQTRDPTARKLMAAWRGRRLARQKLDHG